MLRFRVSGLLEEALLSRSVDVPMVLRTAGLPLAFFRQERVWATSEELFALWEAIGACCPDPGVGLWMGAEVSVERYDPAAIAALCSRTFGDAVTRIQRYKKLTCPEEVRVTSSGSEVAIEFCFFLGEAVPYTLVDLCLSWIWTVGRRGTGQQFQPVRIEMLRSCQHPGLLEEHFGCPVQYGSGRNALVLQASDLERRFVTHNSDLLQMLAPQLEAELSSREMSFGDQIKGVLKNMLAGHRPRVSEVASHLGLTPRTFQRRLTETGLTFQGLLEEARRELARHYLSASSFELNETAYLLGYDDVSSFFRAFHHWEGTTPGQWRCRNRLEVAAI
jgi:AraC-like DNA-binding protein